MKNGVFCGVVVLVLAAAAGAQSFTETFTGNSNVGGWTFGSPIEFIAPSGGNPGAFYRAQGLDTTIPLLRTGEGVSSPFRGDFRGRNVVSVSADVRVFSTDFPIGPFPLTVILYSENGTPGNSNDDWGMYLTGDSIPAPGAPWKSVSFGIPSAATAPPPGWEFIPFGFASPSTPDWNGLMSRVDRLMFSFGDPSFFYIFQMWDVGADNLSITEGAVCYPDCNGDGVLGLADFGCFQTKFALGNMYADCNGDGVLGLADFGCFQTKFALGCP
jgi:hypothetical protein